MDMNVFVGKYKQMCATLLHFYGVITKNEKLITNSRYLHCCGRIQQGQGIATLAAKKQLADWDRRCG